MRGSPWAPDATTTHRAAMISWCGTAEAKLERAVRACVEVDYLRAGANRELGEPSVVVQMGDPGVTRQETIGRAGGRAAGQATHPRLRVQGERVPALGPPRLADPAPLQDDVAHAAPPQVPARGQPRGSRPHDDRVFHRCPLLQGGIVPGMGPARKRRRRSSRPAGSAVEGRSVGAGRGSRFRAGGRGWPPRQRRPIATSCVALRTPTSRRRARSSSPRCWSSG